MDRASATCATYFEPCSTAELTAPPWEEDDAEGPFVLSSWM